MFHNHKELNVAICKLEWRHQHVHRPYMCPQGPLSVVKRRVYLVLTHRIVASIWHTRPYSVVSEFTHYWFTLRVGGSDSGFGGNGVAHQVQVVGHWHNNNKTTEIVVRDLCKTLGFDEGTIFYSLSTQQ